METTLLPGMDAEPKTKKATKAHDPRVSLFLGYWQGLWGKKYQSAYLFRWAADGAIIKRLLRTLDVQSLKPIADSLQPEGSLTRLQTAAERLFNGHLKWFRGKESIGAFSKHINHLLDDQGGSHHGNLQPNADELDRYRDIARRGD